MTQAQVDVFIAGHPDTVIAGDVATPDVNVALFCAQLAAGADAGTPDTVPSPLYLRAPDVSFPKAR